MAFPSKPILRAPILCTLAAGAVMAAATPAPAAEGVLQNGAIGYIITDLHWAGYKTPDAKAECPDGKVNPWGPREQFKVLYPDDGKRSVMDTHFAFEISSWFPDADTPDRFPFYEAKGKYSTGLNLDGKVGPNDFTTPDGELGVDNQLFRAIGCVENYRPPEGTTTFYANKAIMEERYNRMLIEITGVESLDNDNDVTVTMYRGLDELVADATGERYVSGGTMRIDARWGNKFIQKFKGKIVGGTLTTEPVPFGQIPWSSFSLPTVQKFHDMRFHLRLRPEAAVGYIGGYVDVETWYWQTMKSESTHHQSNGQTTLNSLYKVLRKNADAYPDPATGRNTAISGSLEAKFVQTFIVHPPGGTVAAIQDEDSGKKVNK